MPHRISAVNPHGGTSPVQLDVLPDRCPVCHTSVNPELLLGRGTADPPFRVLDVAFQCTKDGCRSVFIARYRGRSATWLAGTVPPFDLESLAPKTPQQTAFGSEITTVSPAFVEIFNQAAAAESVKLDQLVGMGLRRALEFLVKDFALSRATTDVEKAAIRSKLLGRCIDDHIKDEPVRKAAKRATWLGNDETHYERRWEDKDITDLKNLVRLTVNAVENAIMAEKYEAEMPE